MKYYSENLYFENLNSYRKVWEFLIVFLSANQIYSLLKNQLFCKIFCKILYKLFKFDRLKPVKRLGMKKVELIHLQKKNFKSTIFNSHLDLIQKYNIQISPEILKKEIVIYWNRLSVLDLDGKLQKELEKKNIESGNFNWPFTLNKIYSRSGFKKLGNKNSEFASKNILNIPCW